MSIIEVQAQLSFDQFRLGKHYQVDGSDPRIQNQVYAGYFKIVNVPGEGVADPVSGGDAAADLDPGVPGPKKGRKKTEKVTDEADHLRCEGTDLRDLKDVAPG